MLYPEFFNSRLASLAYDLPDGVKCYKYNGDFAAEIAEIDAMLGPRCSNRDARAAGN